MDIEALRDLGLVADESRLGAGDLGMRARYPSMSLGIWALLPQSQAKPRLENRNRVLDETFVDLASSTGDLGVRAEYLSLAT